MLLWARPLAIALLSTSLLAATNGCSNRDLEPLQAPARGLQLAYDLVPGAVYEGRLALGKTTRSDQFPSGQTSWIETAVRLEVVGLDPERGGTLLRATFSNVDLDWNLGPGSLFSLNEFLNTATKLVQGMEVAFTIDARGQVIYMPPAPADAPPELAEVITSLTEALELALPELPDEPLVGGATWQRRDTHGRQGKLGRYRDVTKTSTFDGLFRHAPRDESVAKITAVERGVEVFTTKDGQRTVEIEGKRTTLFSTSGYPVQIEGERRIFDPKQGMQFVKLDVEWKQSAEGRAAGAQPTCVPGSGPACPIVQQPVADPCDPDYVGYEDCDDAQPEPTQPATGEPTQPATGEPTQPAKGEPTQPATGEPTQPGAGEPTRPVTGEPTQSATGEPEPVTPSPTK